MKKLLISAAVGASALLGSNAQAADNLTNSEFYADQTPVVEGVRMVCDEFDRCWREPRRRTVIIERDNYNYAPRQRYIEYDDAPRERYIERRYYGDRPPADVGIHAPGVSVGVGVGGDRW
jgi:hypothetical protein